MAVKQSIRACEQEMLGMFVIQAFIALGFCLAIASNPCTAERPTRSKPVLDWQVQQRVDLEFLASDELRGRSVEDETIHIAADYLAERFAEIGLKTDLFDDGPFQHVMVPVGARPGSIEKNFVRLTSVSSSGSAVEGASAKGQTAFRLPLTEQLDSGMNPLSIGAPEGSFRGGLVFAGYGITAADLGYDDYAGLDVTGKAVILLRKTPGANDPKSLFGADKKSPHAFFSTKVENAIKHGASAVIFINDRDSIAASVARLEKRLKREQLSSDAMRKQIDQLPPDAENTRLQLAKRLESVEPIIQGLRNELAQSKRGLLAINEAGGMVVVDRQRPDTQTAASESAAKGATPETQDKNESKAIDASQDRETKEQATSIPVVSLARDTVESLLARQTRYSLTELERQIDRLQRPQSTVLPDVEVELSVELNSSLVETANVIGELPGRGELADQTVVIGAHYDHVGMGGYGSLAPGTIAIHNGADDNASGTVMMLSLAHILVDRLSDVSSHRRVVFIAFTGEERGLVGSKHYARNPRFPLHSTVTMINLDMVGRLRDNELTVYGTGTSDSFEAIIQQANQQHAFELTSIASGFGPSDHQSFYESGVPVLFFFTGLHSDYHRPSDDSDKIDYGGMTRITDMVGGVSFQLATRSERPDYQETNKRVEIRRQLTAYLGVTLSDREDHVTISAVAAGGPAETAGLRVGDTVTRLNNRAIRTAADMIDLLRSRSPGDTLSIDILRDGQSLQFDVGLQARPGR